jgi:UDP-glucose-4-epimerase GalE
MEKSILITGGAGYIGSHTAKLIAQAGMRPVVLDNLQEGHRWAVQYGPLIEGDIGDTDLVRSVLKKESIEAVIHFAAYTYVGESVENPRKYYDNNLLGTMSLLHAMLDVDVKTIIFSSTCATYGIPEQLPITEATPQCPINPYGETKRAIEGVLRWYGEAYGLRWAALRYFNAAGADADGELGEVHRIETHLIPLALFSAMGLRDQLRVFGTDYPTPDGTCIRDYIHITDLGDAHLRALKYLETKEGNLALNLGTGRGYSIRDVISSVERVTGKSVPYLDVPRRPGDPPELLADATAATEVLDWKPKYSDLDTIVKTAYEFFRTHLDLL